MLIVMHIGVFNFNISTGSFIEMPKKTNRSSGYDGLRPRDVYRSLEKDRRDRFFWEKNAYETRNMIHNEREAAGGGLPAERGARAKPRDVWRSPPEAEARRRINGGGEIWNGPTDPDMKHARRALPPDAPKWQRDLQRNWRKAAKEAKRTGRNFLNKSPLGRAIDLASLIGDLSYGYRPNAGDRKWVHIPGMIKCDGPYTFAATDQTGLIGVITGSHCEPWPLAGQGNYTIVADTATMPVNGVVNVGSIQSAKFIGYEYRFGPGSGVGRLREQSSWRPVSNAPNRPAMAHFTPPFNLPQPNMVMPPNVERYMPPAVQPLASPDYRLAPPTVSEIESLSPAAQGLARSVPTRWAKAVTTGSAGSRMPPVVNIPTTPREPPPSSTKERKVLSRGKLFAIAAFKAMDWASEASDIVDAVYQALPDDVRRRWDRPDRGALDQMGQYGIGGADWKLQALWHNWHRLDVEKALENIVKNQLEDAVYGNIHKHLPKQTGGQAMEPAWEAFAEIMKRLGF